MLWVVWLRSLLCCATHFFFFKQKTAYEMRISDWSSDVCSSDLHRSARDGILDRNEQIRSLARAFSSSRRAPPMQASKPNSLIASSKEIGRASCRERVCQYV